MGSDWVIYALDQLGVKVNHLWAWLILIGGSLLLVGSGVGTFLSIVKVTRKRKGELKGENGISEEQRPIHIESHGQTGGITGIVNIHGDLGPRVSTTDIIHTELENGQHRYESILTIGSQYSVPEIHITAYANSIKSLDVIPQRGGMHMFGHTGKREGYHFTTIQNAAGIYRIRVVTTKDEDVKIDVG